MKIVPFKKEHVLNIKVQPEQLIDLWARWQDDFISFASLGMEAWTIIENKRPLVIGGLTKVGFEETPLFFAVLSEAAGGDKLLKITRLVKERLEKYPKGHVLIKNSWHNSIRWAEILGFKIKRKNFFQGFDLYVKE